MTLINIFYVPGMTINIISGIILSKPDINGTLILKDGAMTVNYLKTPYKISDKVEVKNTVIILNNLKIKDIKIFPNSASKARRPRRR